MWIPYDIRSTLKSDSDAASINMSLADPATRDFMVGFFLRNPVTQAWELDMIAPACGQALPAGAGLPGGSITCHGNDAGKLSEVIYRLAAGSAQQALALAHQDFQMRLLGWQVMIGRGMAIAGWRIADSRYAARWRCTPFRPSAMNVDFGADQRIDPDLAPLAELFQRARNAPDAASRLMAGYAVLHEAWSGHPALQQAVSGGFRVTQEMLVHAVATSLSDRLLDLDLPGLIAATRPYHDRLTKPGGLLAAISDDLAAQQVLAQYANLADLAAHRLILAEIRARKPAPAQAGIMSRGAQEVPDVFLEG